MSYKVKPIGGESNDLEMMFKGTYQSPFYRRLRDVVHQELTLRQRSVEGVCKPAEEHALQAAWRELEAMEVDYKNQHPTRLAGTNALVSMCYKSGT